MILKKLGDEYKLYSHDSCIATTHESPYKKLSLKNCQAIENGYDLEELARESFELDLNCQGDCNNYYERFAYKLGFQKALEILGDKKYTETELYRAFLINSAGNDTTLRNFFEQTVLPMFQDNEWYVEIERETVIRDFNGNVSVSADFKLDADGCLILRRC